MSKDLDELRGRFFSNRKKGEGIVFQGVVTEVNEDEFTCTVKRDEEIDYFDVRLRALVNADLSGFAFIPKLQSSVLVCCIDNSNELFVCQFSEIDKVVYSSGEDKKISLLADLEKMEIKWGDKITLTINEEIIKAVNDKSAIEVKNDKILINGGDLGGLVMIKELKENLDSLKKFVEAIHNALPPAFSAIGAAMSANGILAANAYNGTMAGKTILIKDMENKKVMQ